MKSMCCLCIQFTHENTTERTILHLVKNKFWVWLLALQKRLATPLSVKLLYFTNESISWPQNFLKWLVKPFLPSNWKKIVIVAFNLSNKKINVNCFNWYSILILIKGAMIPVLTVRKQNYYDFHTCTAKIIQSEHCIYLMQWSDWLFFFK